MKLGFYAFSVSGNEILFAYPVITGTGLAHNGKNILSHITCIIYW